MKKILIATLLLVNTSIASAAIQLYTFTGEVVGVEEHIDNIIQTTSMGWTSAEMGDFVSYSVAIDFSQTGFTTNVDGSTSPYIDNEERDFYYVSGVSGPDFSSPINGGFLGAGTTETTVSYNVGSQYTHSSGGTAQNILIGPADDHLRFTTSVGNNVNDFTDGAQWLVSELSYGPDGESAYTTSFVTLNISPVPEPSTLALMLAGFGLIGFKSHRRNKLSA